MIKTSIEQLAGPIGYDIGHSDDVTQAELLNNFFKALSTINCRHDLDVQVCYIVDKLNPTSREMIKLFYSYVNIEE